MGRRAKIVCTLGPAVSSREHVDELVGVGMDVARLNFSHGSHDDHRQMFEWVRAASASAGRPIAVLQDLSGPKLRSGKTGPAAVETGQHLVLVAAADGDAATLAVDYPTLADDVHPGDRILLGDGEIELRVDRVASGRVTCRVEHGGALRARMGVNLPAHRVRGGPITDKDRTDLAFGLGLGVDYVALSFVRHGSDISELRALMGDSPTPIVAKIETPSAVEELDAIVDVADAIMVARGDLGVELSPERVPVVQRQIIEACRRSRRPVIVATEMLGSMVASPRPTRAEASDVASAVFGGTDALMLSAETASGKFPVRSCQMMDRIIREAEASPYHAPRASDPGADLPDGIAHAACALGAEIGAALIVALTESGATARLVSKARPSVEVLALSPRARTSRKLALFWGVSPRVLPAATDVEALIVATRSFVREQGWCKSGDRFVLVYGAPLGRGAATNALRVETVP